MKYNSIITLSNSLIAITTKITFLAFLMFINSNLSAQNVGIGTDTPSQKLEVNGNIKIGENLMIEGNAYDYKIYRNVVAHEFTTAATGAIVIHTNQPATGSQWLMNIEGYIYADTRLFKITVAGYGTDMPQTTYTYTGAEKLPVRVGYTPDDKLIVMLGETSLYSEYAQITVTDFQQAFSNLDESYAEDWYITRETYLAGYSPVLLDESIDKQWDENGNDLYRLSTDVGIGTSSPLYPLHVLYTSDVPNSHGIYSENQSTGTAGTNLSAIKGVMNSGNTTINAKGAIWGVHNNTNGTSCGVFGETNSNGGSGVKGINSTTSRQGMLGTPLYGVYGTSSSGSGNYGYLGGVSYSAYGMHTSGNNGYLGGSDYGVYGTNSNGNNGYFGGVDYGVYGNNANDNYGFLGGPSHAAYGMNVLGNYGFLGGNSNGAEGRHVNLNYGQLGTSSFGVYGELKSTSPADGDYAVYGNGNFSSGNPQGSGYGVLQTNGGVKGYTNWGNAYTFAVAGYSWLDFNRSGATFGGYQDGTSTWGCIAYKNSSGSSYAGYFTSATTTGSGKMAPSQDESVNIGIGAYGDLFGANIHGNIYGIYAEGNNYSLFSNGLVFKNDLDVHLQENEDQSNSVLYTNVSTEVTVQTSGYGQLTDGRSMILFDENFSKVASGQYPIVVTVTPVGNCQGIYLEQVDSNGFRVAENNGGRSSIEFAYIAVAKRRGYENPQLPQEVVDKDYVTKLSQGLHNDTDTQTDGEGLYYKNGELHVGRHPSTFPDESRRAENKTNKD